MSGEINISVLLRFMAEEARRQMTGTGTDLRNLGSAAEEAGRKSTGAGQAIDQTGTAAQGAASGIGATNAALTETVNAAANVAAEMGRTAVSVAGARDAVTGLATTSGSALQPINTMTMAMTAQRTAMQQAVTSWVGLKAATDTTIAAELRHGMMLDDLRAKFNPLFAASRQYEVLLHEIADAERMGALSTQEAAAARERAAQGFAPTIQRYGQAVNQGAGHTANLVAQWNDIGVMMAAGQNPLQLALQQGTQVSQVLTQLGGGTSAVKAVGTSLLGLLNPVSLATIGIIGFGAAGIQWLMKMGGETKSFDANLKDLNATLGRMRSNLDLIGKVRLEDTFGNLTGSVRGLAQGMLELDRASELKQFGQIIDTFLNKEVDETFLQRTTRAIATGMVGGVGAEVPFEPEANSAANYAALGAANSYEDFQSRTKEIKELAENGDIDTVVEKLQALQAAMSGGGPVSGMKTELRGLLGELATAGIKMAENEAMWNGSAQAKAITHQIDQMVQGYTQQTELAETSLRFGENSVQVEAVRARQMREALRIRLQELKVEEDSADAVRARAALEAKLASDSEAAQARRQRAQVDIFTDLGRQTDLSNAILRYGEQSAEVEAVRARQAWDVQEARMQELGLAPQMIALAQTLFNYERERANAIKAAAVAKQTDDLLDDLRSEAEINQAIVKYGEDSVRVKELQIAAERRAFEQTLATMQVTEEMKGHLREAWEAARGMASADPFGALAKAGSYLRDQQERIDKLKLEQSLLGQNEAIQKRVIALWEVERDIRRNGIDATSARAAEMRANAVQEAELTQLKDRQQAAWGSVQSAAEDAIDGIVDSLMKGDIGGALDALAADITGTFTELAITNPLKNVLLGTNLGTAQDVGGLSGIWGRLTGKAEMPEMPAISDFSAASMAVNAGTVTINGTIAGGVPGATAANINSAPMSGTGGLAGPRSIQEQVWNFFSGKGLAPHQVAGILGNISQESGFNPLAKGDYRDGAATSVGLFQHHDTRAQDLLSAVGGAGGLGNVQAQLEHVWQELLTSENGALKGLLASTNVQDATSSFMRNFERPSQDAMAQSFPQRLGAADEALKRFGNTTSDTAGNLGTLGQGFGAFGNALSSALSGAASGGAQGGLGGLLGSIGSSLGNWVVGALGIPTAPAAAIPGFATGGQHIGGLRIVGENGPELEYTGPSTILPADLTRSVLAARSPVAAMAQQTPIDTRPVINITNNSSAAITGEVEESTGPRGQRQYSLAVSDAVAQGLSAPGGRGGKTMRDLYGARQGPRRRS
jgi:hypothetical protein